MSSIVDSLGHGWYPACRSARLGRRPLARTVRGLDLALFRLPDGRAAALLDRCPHRNVPLSWGRCTERGLECRYHGWTFDGAGRCVRVPGLDGSPDRKGRGVRSLPVRESDGLTWVWTAESEPTGEPFRFPDADEARCTLRYETVLRAGLHAALENILDVPHTAFLHGGLFRRSDRTNDIEAIVRRGEDRVEAEYVGEPRPSGLAGRLLAPGGGTVAHVDRFILPSIAQVEYAIGEDLHLSSTSALNPEAPFRTRLHATIHWRSRIPGPLLLPVLAPLAWWILRQDAKVLARQTRNIQRHGGERYSSTELDVLGPDVARLLRGDRLGGEAERRVRFRA